MRPAMQKTVRLFLRYCYQAGFLAVDLSALYAFASRLHGQVPFKDLVDMLGHRSPSTTLLYGKMDVATLKKAALPWPGGVR
jgi:hypothetical protein